MLRSALVVAVLASFSLSATPAAAEEAADRSSLETGWGSHGTPGPCPVPRSPVSASFTWDKDDWTIDYIGHSYFGAAYHIRARERGFDRIDAAAG